MDGDEDGKVIDQGSLGRLDLARRRLGGHAALEAAPGGEECFLRVAFTLPEKAAWAPAGFEVASQQLALPRVPISGGAQSSAKPLKLTRTAERITVAGDGFTVVFDRSEGTISKLERNGRNLLARGGGPKLHLWRSPHRNDDMWAYNDWMRNGLMDLKRETVRLEAEEVDANAVRVEVGVMATGRNGFRVLHSAMYTVEPEGSIAVDNAVMPQGRRIPIARLGVRLLLDKQLDQFTYLGRGPMENYPDRKRGFDVGLYTSTVRENMTPYAKPMECGNHEDVRWAGLSGKKLPGLIAQADPDRGLLAVSALPYTDEVMTPIEYTVDLPPSESTVVTLAAKTLGVGSNGCGPPHSTSASSGPTRRRSLTCSTRSRRAPPATCPPWGGASCRRIARPVLAHRGQNGRVELQAPPCACIEYTLDGTTWTPYAKPFEHPAAGIFPVRARAEHRKLRGRGRLWCGRRAHRLERCQR